MLSTVEISHVFTVICQKYSLKVIEEIQLHCGRFLLPMAILGGPKKFCFHDAKFGIKFLCAQAKEDFFWSMAFSLLALSWDTFLVLGLRALL